MIGDYIERFIEIARELDCGEAFEAKLARVMRRQAKGRTWNDAQRLMFVP
jgi:hypothetical protein